jgi:peptidyl-prolyl cis-trans isomerase C
MRLFSRRAAAMLVSTVVAGSSFAQAPVPGAPPAPIPGSPVPTLPTPAPAKPIERPTGIAATVNNQQIPEVAVWRALRQFPVEEHPIARKEILNHLVENMLIDQYLVALKTEVTPAEVDKLMEELKGELKKANKDYTKELEAMMLTEAEFRVEVSAQMKWDKFLKTQGTDQALAQFFEKRPDLFDGTLVRARHILITPGTDAAKVAEAKNKLNGIKATVLAEGEKVAAATPGDALAKEQAKGKRVDELFAQFAKDHSTCPSNKNGGDLQYFPRVGAMVEPFAEAAFKLNVYQMTDIVETEFGQHLILITDKKPGTPKKFDAVKEDVRVVYAMQLRTAVVGQMKPKSQIVITPVAGPATTAPMTPATTPMK